MTYRAILFDLDGTLLDSVPMIVKVTREALESMGIHFDDVTIRHSVGLPLKVQAHRFARDREQEFIDIYRGIYRERLAEEARLFPGTLEMLSTLRSKGCLTAVVTSKSARGTARVLESSGLSGMFEGVVTADDVTHPKPDPEPLQKAIEQLQVTGAESLYVGDSAFDVEMARRACVRMVAVSWGARTRDELKLICSDGVVDNWQQLLEIVLSDQQPQPGSA